MELPKADHRNLSFKRAAFQYFKILFLVTVLTILEGCAHDKRATLPTIPRNGYAVHVENSGNREVDALVSKLVSKRPAPYPAGEIDTPDAVVFADKYATAEVVASIKRLKELGPPIFPALVKHLYDNRYSYSMVVEAWVNCSVGDAIVEVLDDDHPMHCGYKWRDTPSGNGGGYLSFGHYLKDRDAAVWAEWAKTKSRLEIQLDFIDWCVRKENERGYVSDKQKADLLARYENARDKMKKLYSK